MEEVDMMPFWKNWYTSKNPGERSHMFGSTLMLFLPLIAVIVAALASLGGNDWEYPTWNVDNPLRYETWGFWTSAVLSSFFYGWFLMLLWRHHQTRVRWKLWFLLLLPVVFITAYVGTEYCQDNNPIAGAYLAFTALASLVVAVAAAAACAKKPEVVFYAILSVAWFVYETNLASTEAAGTPIP